MFVLRSIILITLCASPAYGDDLVQVTLVDDNKQQLSIDARTVVQAEDGGLLLQDRTGALWTVTPDRLVASALTGEQFAPFTADELGEHWQTRLGDGFEVHTTAHYVIVSNTGDVYPRWVGKLFERLHAGFTRYWLATGLDLHEPEFPLPVIVFANQQQFAEFISTDVSPSLAEAKGYYSMKSNAVVIYDLTATPGARPARSAGDITRKVAASPVGVSTVIHEATHQVAFNIGVQTRYADNPLWLTEGLAMLCETPDLRSRTGWRTIGRLNTRRLHQFREVTRQNDSSMSLRSIVADNATFQDPQTATAAYAQSWALTHFLITEHKEAFVEYVKTISSKPVLQWDEPDTRVRQLEEALGMTVEEMSAGMREELSQR